MAIRWHPTTIHAFGPQKFTLEWEGSTHPQTRYLDDLLRNQVVAEI